MRSTLIEGVSVLIESKGILNFGSCRLRFFLEKRYESRLFKRLFEREQLFERKQSNMVSAR